MSGWHSWNDFNTIIIPMISRIKKMWFCLALTLQCKFETIIQKNNCIKPKKIESIKETLHILGLNFSSITVIQ